MAANAPRPAAKPRSFRWTFGLIAGLALLGILVLIAVFAPIVLNGPASELTENANAGPSAQHLIGTDGLGRDMLARSLVATRLTLLMALAATLISAVCGIVLGALIWLAPARVREIGLRFVELLVAYPSIIMSIIIAAILSPGVVTAIIAIGVAGIASFARITANMAASLSQRDFIVTAKLLGVRPLRILRKHLLPNMAEPLLLYSASTFGLVLMEISGLSFIGLGVQSPDYDFGRLMVDGLHAIYTNPVQVVGPVLMIILTGLAIMLIGDGLAAASNVRAGTAMLTRRSAGDVAIASATQASSDSLLEVRDLWIRNSAGTAIVKGVSLEIRKGEILGVVGESGSGKSLTAMSIAKLLPDGLELSANELRLGDLNLLDDVDPKVLATRLGLIYQDPGTTFNPALRMGSQLTEVPRTHMGLSKADAVERVLKGLRMVHITEPEKRLRQHPHELSGGMKQRAIIASSLVTDPALIIADEPTTALDVTVQAEILRGFMQINRELHTSMLFISHDLGVVEELCDRVIVMKDGLIVEELTGAQLKAREAKHPYTRALLASTPSLEPRLIEAIAELPTASVKTIMATESVETIRSVQENEK